MSITNHPVEQEELMAYLDGELSPDRSATTAGHLEECPQCRQLAAELEEVSEMLGAWQVEQAERAPAKSVTDRLAKRGLTKFKSPAIRWRELIDPRRWPTPIWALAALAVIGVLVVTAPKYQSVRDQAPASAPSTYGVPPSPFATPRPGQAAEANKIDGDGQVKSDLNGQVTSDLPSLPAANGPMIIRTAELDLTTDAFDKARVALDEVLKRHHGYVGQLNVNTPSGSARSLTGTLRVPANQLDATLTDLKGLGRAEKESQGGEEVTQQYVDLEARLSNAKHTEKRLSDMLRDRTGKLSDVLAVEIEISRVRGEIEQMEAERKTMKNQVDLATITVTVTEAYKAELNAVPPSTGTEFRNAAVQGYRSLVGGIISVLVWLLSAGPTLVVWAAILFFPVRMLWKKLRPRFVK
ncbi:MAG TPA: DUF4349 domain-containing protein [Terriglobales bacterium]